MDGTDPAIKTGALFQFLLILDDGSNHRLACAFTPNIDTPEQARPFEITFRSLITQRGGVTITNNVINPDKGQTARVTYTLDKQGPVTILVFDMSGSIVSVLHRGTQSAGEYSETWDGRNRGGRAVTRGVYFVRVVGPGFDEIRKVLVVR